MTNIALYNNNFSGFITKLCSAGKNSLNARRCENKCFIAHYFLSHTLPSKLLLRICSTKEFIWSQENRTFLRASISSVGLLYINFFLCLWFCSICLYCPKCPNCPIFSKLYNLSYLFQFCPKSPILSKVSKMSKVSNSVQRVQNV